MFIIDKRQFSHKSDTHGHIYKAIFTELLTIIFKGLSIFLYDLSTSYLCCALLVSTNTVMSPAIQLWSIRVTGTQHTL